MCLLCFYCSALPSPPQVWCGVLITIQINIEALCAALPEALAHSPSQMPLSCPIAPLSQRVASALTSRATHAHPTSPRSTGFCAIWGCISSSSSSSGGGGGGVASRARATHRQTDTQTDNGIYRKWPPLYAHMCSYPLFEVTPLGAAPGPPFKTGARVRRFRGCNELGVTTEKNMAAHSSDSYS